MELHEAYESLKLKFTSGNPIAVERAVITSEEWEAIRLILLWAISSGVKDI